MYRPIGADPVSLFYRANPKKGGPPDRWERRSVLVYDAEGGVVSVDVYEVEKGCRFRFPGNPARTGITSGLHMAETTDVPAY